MYNLANSLPLMTSPHIKFTIYFRRKIIARDIVKKSRCLVIFFPKINTRSHLMRFEKNNYQQRKQEQVIRQARDELQERVREFCQEQEQFEEDTELVDLLLTEF